MIDNKVSVRRYAKAMLAATARSECLGLLLVAGRPSEIHTAPPAHGAPPLRDVLGPYLGVARPVAAGHEGAGVVLPEGGRVLADGLDAHCWPGSEAAFREELGTPSPASWGEDRRARRAGGVANVAARAAADLAAYVGIDPRAMPAVVVLDPEARRGVVVSVPRGSSVWGIGRRLVEELDDWPHRRLGVVDALVAARMERAALASPHDAGLPGLRADFDAARRLHDEHTRATATARCHDALRAVEGRAVPPASATQDRPAPDEEPARRLADLDAVIARVRGELDHGDRAARTADAAGRAARAEVGSLRSTTVRAPDALDGWRIERLSAPGVLHRVFGGRRRAVVS